MDEDEYAMDIFVHAKIIINRRRRERKKAEKRAITRSIWQRNWIAARNEQGAFNNLMRELKEGDIEGYTNFVRMDLDHFNSLLEKITPHIARQHTRLRAAISPAERLAVTLRYLATGETFKSLSYLYRLGETTVGAIIPETCRAIYSVLKEEYFKFPSSTEDWKKISDEFRIRWNFPMCIGAIDGKHVHIRPPPGSGSEFFNYKNTFSVVLMALVDADYKFIYCDVGCNGRVSDGGVFRKCSLASLLEHRTADIPAAESLPGNFAQCSYHIVADEAFPLKDYIMKPYPQRNLTDEQRIYNYRLSRARRVVENAFGILSNRFRVFHTSINLDPAKVVDIVLAATVLHNYLRSSADAKYVGSGLIDIENIQDGHVEPGLWRQSGRLEQEPMPRAGRHSYADKEKRDMLKAFFQSPEGSVPWQDQMV